jgi:hypothetical protein
MSKKQSDRRPDQKPAEGGPGNDDPKDLGKPEAGRRMPQVPEDRKGFRQPEGDPIDKQAPKPGTQSGGKDILDGGRSDRESGRPVQLEEDDDERQPFPRRQPGRADSEPGVGGRPQDGREGRRPGEVERTKR